jgi:transcriptional regulator with XRE-family HTH domain
MSKDYKKILVPDVLPNNLRVIREMRRLELKKVANDLGIDRNFLSAVEVENKNFSGKTTIKVLKYFDISFYKLYDVKEKRVCAVTDSLTDYDDSVFKTTLDFKYEDLLDSDSEFKNDIEIENEIKSMVTDGIEALRENNLIISRLNKVAKDNKITGKYYSFDVVGISFEERKVYLELEVTFEEKRTELRDFDINFINNENYELADMLTKRGFQDTIRTIDKEVDGKNIRVEGNSIRLDKVYKLPKGDNVTKYTEKDSINLSDKNLVVKYDDITREPISIRFKAIKPEMNLLKVIRAITNISIDEMHINLGLSYNGYINLELGNQKISTKVMWRLVERLKLPLELILNIDEYYEKYCIEDSSDDNE